MSRPRSEREGGGGLDPFGDAPPVRPEPVDLTCLAAASAGTVLVLAGVCGGLVAALCGGAAAGYVPAQLPLFIGPFTTSALANGLHVMAGGWGLVAARRPARARTFLRVGGLGYLLWSVVETVAAGAGSSAVLAVGTGGGAVDLPPVAPLGHFVVAAVMVLAGMRRSW